jgi:hypothetical protein
MSWAVRGLVGQIGEPIRVRLKIKLDPLLGIKLASYIRRRLVLVEASNENYLLGLAPFYPCPCGPAVAIGEVGC